MGCDNNLHFEFNLSFVIKSSQLGSYMGVGCEKIAERFMPVAERLGEPTKFDGRTVSQMGERENDESDVGIEPVTSYDRVNVETVKDFDGAKEKMCIGKKSTSSV